MKLHRFLQYFERITVPNPLDVSIGFETANGIKLDIASVRYDVADCKWVVELKDLSHARTSPGPENCQKWLRFQGRPYPRTCSRCGLHSPCPFYNDDGTSKLQGGKDALDGRDQNSQ